MYNKKNWFNYNAHYERLTFDGFHLKFIYIIKCLIAKLNEINKQIKMLLNKEPINLKNLINLLI